MRFAAVCQSPLPYPFWKHHGFTRTHLKPCGKSADALTNITWCVVGATIQWHGNSNTAKQFNFTSTCVLPLLPFLLIHHHLHIYRCSFDLWGASHGSSEHPPPRWVFFSLSHLPCWPFLPSSSAQCCLHGRWPCGPWMLYGHSLECPPFTSLALIISGGGLLGHECCMGLR